MTETIMPPEVLAALKPEFVAPLVGFLTHESVNENGSLFELGAGYVTKLRYERSKGAVFKADESFTPASVAAKWGQICDFTNPSYPSGITDTDWLGLLEQAKALDSNPKPPPLRFDGKVVLVTGAGSGLGRAYAHMFAKLGASVVVNDLGGGLSGGSGASARAADTVVNEIKSMGGIAVANYDSVLDGDKVVGTAIQNFGRIDVVVNNAGILRDRSFSRMTDQDWDLVYNVHLRGTYKVLKAAWPHMLKNKYGRIINTASAVGLYGNFGQANYSSAKAGIIALSNSLALEGKKHNILINTIAPNAGTRMTATIMPPEMVEAFKPEYVAPLVGYLGHESTQSTGGVFETGSCWVAKVRWQRAKGFGFPHNQELKPEHIASKWQNITNFDDGRATYPASTQDSFQEVYANVTNVAEGKPSVSSARFSNSTVDVEKVLQMKFEPVRMEYTHRDTILYALGVGAKKSELDILYENNENFFSLPTFGVILGFAAQMNVPMGDIFPNFNPMLLLHGEQYLEIKKPIPTSATLLSKARVLDICDKGKGAVVSIGVNTTDANGNEICYNEGTIFIRGVGGFGGPKNRKNIPYPASVAPNTIPKRAPDAIVKEKTLKEQATLYRLSGDYNPLHIDPQMSSIGGFKEPILHGLCFYGYAGRHILRKYGNSDPKNFKSIKGRFSSSVYPGETLQTEMWVEGSKVLFQVRVVERDTIVLSNAAVELHNLGSGSVSGPSIVKQASGAVGGSDGFKSAVLFMNLSKGLNSMSSQQRQAQMKKVKAVFQFDISKDGGKKTFYIDLKLEGAAGEGVPSNKPDVIISVSDDDFADLAAGKINGQKAFMSGKIKIKGQMMLAMKLDSVLKAATPGAKL